jgi:L-seryl-tRNA(Ser) seleniumtransferase
MDTRRRIPSVDGLLAAPDFLELMGRLGRDRVVRALRAVQEQVRAGAGEGDPPTAPGWYAARVQARLESEDQPSLRPVINATGVVLHTNLGRAPLAEAARRAVARATGYATLEYDLEAGTRGSRHDHCVDLLRELTGAEGAVVVNNNAAAVVLALNTLAQGGEAIVSRGELVEIGGSFRVPEIMARSGAVMREVGATNRTHLRDYQDALGPATRVILKVHRSNFTLEGFTAEVGVDRLAPMAGEAGVPIIHDLGSGALVDLSRFGLPHEPTVREAVEEGADVVTLSGDKLLGGPQAGILVGRADLMDRIRANPLCRAFRCDKLTLAALEATLALYRDPDVALREVPTLRMLGAQPAELDARATALAASLSSHGVRAETRPESSTVGGGAVPGARLPTTVVAIDPVTEGADGLAKRLRTGDPAVVARVRDGRLLLDPRTVHPDEDAALVDAVVRAVAADSPR